MSIYKFCYIIKNAYVSFAASRVNRGTSNQERSQRNVVTFVKLTMDRSSPS